MTRHRRDPAPLERIRPGLERIQAALSAAGNPEAGYPAIHVAGTNGKGSTSVFAASVCGSLPALRVGLYTSPHLLSPTERIRVDGEPIPAAALDALVERAAAPVDPTTWFERMTFAAFCWFRERKVDLAVLETGLGGRWDATNVCRPAVCAVTTIGIDHVEWLGPTIRGIAAEKAGILKPGVPVVLGRLGRAAGKVVRDRAREMGAPVWQLDRDFGVEPCGAGRFRLRLPGATVERFAPGLAGAHQLDNAAVGCAAAWRYAADRGIPADVFLPAARAGIAAARWPGRLSPLPGRGNRGAWADGAHNPAAARVLARELADPGLLGGRRPVVALWSMLADKHIGGFVRTLAPSIDRWVAYPLRHERAASVDRLAAACTRAGLEVEKAADFAAGWKVARAIAGEGGAVIVCGSLVAVADAYSERVGHI
jgi:dihydrofolate synthase/folylpolyglutamate synthase